MPHFTDPFSIPSREECELSISKGTPTHLEAFLYVNAPTGIEERHFRESLRGVLQEFAVSLLKNNGLLIQAECSIRDLQNRVRQTASMSPDETFAQRGNRNDAALVYSEYVISKIEEALRGS